MSWLKALAPSNMNPMFVTFEVFHGEISALNLEVVVTTPPHELSPVGQSRNSSDMSVTSDTFQLCISSSPAGPQSAVAQHATPSKGATRRHSSTAILSSALLKKGASEPRGHGSRQPELASREDAFKCPASEKPAQAECWSGSLATRVRVIRRSHRAARRYEHVWRQTRRIRLRWGRHPSADKARALLE